MQDSDEMEELHHIARLRAIADDLRNKRNSLIDRLASTSKKSKTAFQLLNKIEDLSEQIERVGQ
jgi:hypothetical protein